MQQLLLRGSHECCSREHFHMKRRTTRRAKEHKEWRTWHLRRRHPEILRYKCVVGFAARMIPANWTFGWFQFLWFQKEKLCVRLKIFFSSSHQICLCSVIRNIFLVPFGLFCAAKARELLCGSGPKHFLIGKVLVFSQNLQCRSK